MKTPIVRVRLAVPEVPEESQLRSQCWLAAGVSTYREGEMLFFCAPHIRKDPSLGEFYPEVKPASDGKFTLELGVVLPDVLPNPDRQIEYWMDVPTEDGLSQRVMFSNQMARLRYKEDDQDLHALACRCMLGAIQKGEVEPVPPDASVELLRTFACTRFRLAAKTAEEVLEENLEGKVQEFISALNCVLMGYLAIKTPEGLLKSAYYDKSTFDAVYFIIQGDPAGPLGHARIATHVGNVALNPVQLNADDSKQWAAYVNGAAQIDDIRLLLNVGKSFLDAGLMKYTLLQLVIAAEVATRRYVHKSLLAAGVSKTKLAAVQEDLT